MIRATTGGVMRTYRSNLMNSFINMNKSMSTILSQRTFNSFAEDPAAAAKAFRLRKSRMTVESQYDICTDTHKKYETAVACLQSIDDVLCTKEGEYGYYMKTLTGTTLSMLNDPTGDAREQLNKVLDQISQSIIQTMNQKYGDNFIFSGADGHNVPFEIVGNKLYYRGVPVDAAMPNVLKDAGGNLLTVSDDGKVDDTAGTYLNMNNVKKITQDEYEELYAVPKLQEYPAVGSGTPLECDYDDDGNMVYTPGGKYYMRADENGDPTGEPILKEDYDAIVARQDSLLKQDDGTGSGNTTLVKVNKNGEIDENGEFYVVFDKEQLMSPEAYEKQKLDYEKLQYLAGETCFVDIGFGFQEDPVTGKLIESSAFDSALIGINFLGYGLDEDGDPNNIYSLVQKMREVAKNANESDSWNKDWDEFNRLVGKLEDAVSTYQTEFVNLDASTGKLKSQTGLLEDNFDNLVEQCSNLEDVDMADAITSFLWAQYSYNAALKVGNSILSESLMDYLR